jgi:hypothetical protein
LSDIGYHSRGRSFFDLIRFLPQVFARTACHSAGAAE